MKITTRKKLKWWSLLYVGNMDSRFVKIFFNQCSGSETRFSDSQKSANVAHWTLIDDFNATLVAAWLRHLLLQFWQFVCFLTQWPISSLQFSWFSERALRFLKRRSLSLWIGTRILDFIQGISWPWIAKEFLSCKSVTETTYTKLWGFSPP